MTEVVRSKQNTIVIYLMSAVLIWGAFGAVTVPAGEFPPAPYHIFLLGLDVLMTVILAVLLFTERSQVMTAQRAGAMILGVLGVVAGVLKVLIRFSSDHGWWTGHYMAPVFN